MLIIIVTMLATATFCTSAATQNDTALDLPIGLPTFQQELYDTALDDDDDDKI